MRYMNTVYFDLDGTLLDVSERYWQLHSLLVREHGLAATTRRYYWTLVRRQAPLEEVVGGTEAERMAYRRDWLELIEDPRFLSYDRLVPGASEVLAQLGHCYRIAAISMRKDPAALADQLEWLDMESLFRRVLCKGNRRVKEKANLVRCDEPNTQPVLVVGDTQTDVKAAHALGVPAAAVTNGLCDETRLMEAEPDYLLHSIRGLPPAMAEPREAMAAAA